MTLRIPQGFAENVSVCCSHSLGQTLKKLVDNFNMLQFINTKIPHGLSGVAKKAKNLSKTATAIAGCVYRIKTWDLFLRVQVN